MKISLKYKLIISYVLLSLFLVSSLLVVSNYFLEKKFQNYIINLQENKNQNIVKLVEEQFGEDNELTNTYSIKNIGDTALSQGLILMINDLNGNQVFCESDFDSQIMLENMRTHMASIYPNFNGQYEEKQYDILKNGNKLGTVTLGFYGPFYYNDEDVQFLHVLNGIFIILAVVFLIVAVILGYLMAIRISKPIKIVIDKTKQLETGKYSNRITLTSDTIEINQLIHSVNTLAETLERQQLSKKQMARDYAHEFRTPLATLQSNLEAMLDGIWEPTEKRLDSCREEIIRLTRMISEIDKIVKIENESMPIEKTTFDLAESVNQISLTFEPLAISKNIKIKTELQKCMLNADKDKIIQVIINLLSNAIKYTDANGTITIKVKNDRHNANLIVSDTGIGISSEDIPNIFEHLYRVDKSRDRNTGGSGIGLSVVRAIIDAHGGSILVKSELGKGSQFIIKIPN